MYFLSHCRRLNKVPNLPKIMPFWIILWVGPPYSLAIHIQNEIGLESECYDHLSFFFPKKKIILFKSTLRAHTQWTLRLWRKIYLIILDNKARVCFITSVWRFNCAKANVWHWVWSWYVASQFIKVVRDILWDLKRRKNLYCCMPFVTFLSWIWFWVWCNCLLKCHHSYV